MVTEVKAIVIFGGKVAEGWDLGVLEIFSFLLLINGFIHFVKTQVIYLIYIFFFMSIMLNQKLT